MLSTYFLRAIMLIFSNSKKKKKEFKKKDNGNWLFAILCMVVSTKSVNFFKSSLSKLQELKMLC